MKKSIIHQTPDERLASASNLTNELLMKILNQPPMNVRALQGDKGDKGDSIKGDRGDPGNDGKDGKDGLDGKDGKDGKDGRDGINGSPDTPDEIVAKLNTSEKLIDAERVRGLVKAIRDIEGYGTNPSGAAGGGSELRYLSVGALISAHVTALNFGTGINATYGGEGQINISASAPVAETPVGTVDASNNIFTVTAEPTYVVSDGITYFANNGYTYAALTITMDIPPSAYIRAFT